MDNHTWEILSLYTVPTKDGLANVVKKINWRFQITEDKYYGDVYGHTELPEVTSDSFVAYDDLSEEKIIAWVKEHGNNDAIVAEATAKLEKNKNPSIVEKNPPWTYPITTDGTEEYMVVIDNSPNDLQKIYGPLRWNSVKINEGLKLRGFSDLSVPDTMIAFRKGLIPSNEPLVLKDNVKIYKVQEQAQPTFDELTQVREDLTYDTSSGICVGTYNIVNKSLDEVKASVKVRAKEERIGLSFQTHTMSLNGTDYKVNIEEQSNIVTNNRANVMSDSDTINWKLEDSWIVATKADLMAINNFVMAKRQEIFDGEHTRSQEIDACTTTDQLKTIYNSITVL